MTDSKMEALARQLVACPRFRWLPGMAIFGDAIDGQGRLLAVSKGKLCAHDGDDDRDGWIGAVNPAHVLPDLRDAATLGCLLQLVREAWGPQTGTVVSVWPDHAAVKVCKAVTAETLTAWRGDTEAEALVAALLAAPEAA